MVDATVDTLLARVEGDVQPQKIRIEGPLIIRGSARKPEAS
jgi:DNA-binding LacI/PurR family transcriptional regulator